MNIKKIKPKKSNNHAMTMNSSEQQKNIKELLSLTVEKSQAIINRYTLLFAVSVSSVTVIIALLIAQHYINPTRDEQLYLEGGTQTNYKQVDVEKLKILEESLEKSIVEVDTKFVPDRNNPFSE